MAIVTVSGLTKSFGVRTLFSDVSFEVEPRDRIGLVGQNGCGKTTLFRIIEGLDRADGGGLFVSRACRIAHLDQAAEFPEGTTVEEAALAVFSELTQLETELERVNALIGRGGGDLEKQVRQQDRLYDQFIRLGGLTYRSRMRAACLGLGFSEADLARRIGTLSDGERRMVWLAMLLQSDANVLLLDEPTNRRDISAVEWLEGFLTGYSGAYVVISHDRYFLDRVTEKTMELENGRLTVTRGNYSRHVELKMDNRALTQRHYDNMQREIKRIEGIIEQQRRWNQARNYVTIASKQKQIDRLRAELVKPEPLPPELRFRFRAVESSGNEVLLTKSLSKGFAEKPLFANVDVLIQKNERVCLLGPNGCGKTTLLRTISGQLEPDAGTYVVGANVRIGYYDQNVACDHPEKTIFDDVFDAFPRLEPQQIRNTLGQFLFPGDAVYKRMGDLSGGELARIQLLKLLMSGCNFLLLDEPTNHLDIASREALEKALSDYGGTMLAVTHDRYFINRLADRLLVMKNGTVESIEGDWDAYKALLSEETAGEQPKSAEPEEQPVNEYVKNKAARARAARARTELARAEKAVAEAERDVRALEELLETPDVQRDYERTNELFGRLTAQRASLDESYAAWEAAERAFAALETEG